MIDDVFSNTESVRDVQFSPHNPYTFSAVSDNGSVQLWDIRKTEKCILQYTAHSGPVFACDWHPETLWLATASRDKTIKVSIKSIIKIRLVYCIICQFYFLRRLQSSYIIQICRTIIIV